MTLPLASGKRRANRTAATFWPAEGFMSTFMNATVSAGSTLSGWGPPPFSLLKAVQPTPAAAVPATMATRPPTSATVLARLCFCTGASSVSGMTM